MRDRLQRHYGAIFTAIGLVHILVAIAQFWDEWRDLFADGFFGQIDEQGASYQAAGYWFLILGPMLIATGRLAQAQLDATGTLPRAFGWTLAGTSFVAGLAFPLSGIWLVGLTGLLGVWLATPDAGHRRMPAPCPETSRS